MGQLPTTPSTGASLGRWRLLLRVAASDGVERWRAVAEDTGEPGEVLIAATSDPAARRAFHDLHRRLARVTDPAVARTFEARQGPDGVYAVRAPLEDLGLDSVAGPLDAGTVAWIGATLLPAVLAAGGATRSALAPRDVGLDASGRPVLAPIAAPTGRIGVGATRSVAPESFAGAVSDGPAGLYGLGALLYRLSTGREPPTAGTRADRSPPPPPSALRHGIPPGLDRAILRLLSADPAERAGALPLLQEAAGPPADLRAHARRVAVTGDVITTVSADRPRSARQEGAPAALVLLPGAELQTLDPAGRSLVAGLARVPIATVDGLVTAGLPLVLETAPGRSAARARAAELARSTGMAVAHGTAAALPSWLPAATGAAVALLPAAIAVGLLLAGVVPIAIVMLVLAALILLAGVLAGQRLGATRKLHEDGLRSLVRARAELAERSAGGHLDAAWDRLARLRVQVARADLPAAAASDLRGALKDIEHRLDGLARVAAAAEEALAEVDPAALRTRLAALERRAGADDEVRAERDRLARTVADLDAVDERRGRVGADVARLVDGMGEIAALLGRLGDEVTYDDALEALGRTVRDVPVLSADGRAERASEGRASVAPFPPPTPGTARGFGASESTAPPVPANEAPNPRAPAEGDGTGAELASEAGPGDRKRPVAPRARLPEDG